MQFKTESFSITNLIAPRVLKALMLELFRLYCLLKPYVRNLDSIGYTLTIHPYGMNWFVVSDMCNYFGDQAIFRSGYCILSVHMKSLIPQVLWNPIWLTRIWPSFTKATTSIILSSYSASIEDMVYVVLCPSRGLLQLITRVLATLWTERFCIF